MKYTAALFDLDGTLTESGEGIMKSFRYAFEKMNLPLSADADLSVVIGPPLKGSFARFGVPEERLDEAVRTYRERYNTILVWKNCSEDCVKKAFCCMWPPASPNLWQRIF